MVQSKLPVRTIGIAAGLAAISAVTQLTHIGYQSPQFGMWIDIVAVSWLVAYFMFGPRLSFIVSILGAIVITLFAPDTWLGASMKWIATTPLWITLAVWIRISHKPLQHYRSPQSLVLPLLIGIFIRCLVVIPLNYYYAIPIWTGMTTAQAMSAIPWYIIAIFNIIQSGIDVGLAWILVYTFKLYRFTSQQEISP
jgi:riboflavin transporter FmnP